MTHPNTHSTHDEETSYGNLIEMTQLISDLHGSERVSHGYIEKAGSVITLRDGKKIFVKPDTENLGSFSISMEEGKSLIVRTREDLVRALLT